jgi:SAM-dependent methyltransferase
MGTTAMIDVTKDNVARYQQPRFFLFRGERQLVDTLVQPRMRVLDLGCGNGRVSKYLLQRGACVLGCDLSRTALRELQENLSAHRDLAISQGDARQLPFKDHSFHAVVFAFAGIDYIYPEADRLGALREIERVLAPGGCFIFSSHNPLGTLLSPRGFRSWRGCRWRGRYLVSGAWGKVYFRDYGGILLYQALPQKVIKQVTTQTRMQFCLAISRSGSVTSRTILSIFSAGPYYVFKSNRIC